MDSLHYWPTPARVLGRVLLRLKLLGEVSVLALALSTGSVYAAVFTAAAETQLIQAINDANASGDASSTITLTADFIVTNPSALPEVTKTLTIDSGAFTLTSNGDESLKVGASGALTLTGNTVTNSSAGRLFKQGDGLATLTDVTGNYFGGITVEGGTLRIDGGSQIVMGNAMNGSVMMYNSGAATLVISGPDTKVTARTGAASLGSKSGTTMIVEKGAAYDQGSGTFQLGNSTGHNGNLKVDGVGSFFKGMNLNLFGGQATISITAGGELTSTITSLGGLNTIDRGGSATVLVSGKGARWENSGNFLLIRGTLDILDEGIVETSVMRLATVNAGSSAASAVVSGQGSELVVTGTAANTFQIAGGTGAGDRMGSLSIANGGKVTVAGGAGTIDMATNATSSAILNIGGAEGEAATTAGTLSASKLAFGPGTSIVNFNHTDAAYGFDVALEGNGAINHIGSGKTVLAANQLLFTGKTNVAAGILEVDGILGGAIDVFGGRLQGIGTVGTTSHEAGSVIAPGNSIGTLTINGDYIGNGGLVEIETVLGDDSSNTDLLKITGNTSGTANVQVINVGGVGAPTVDGIKIIDIDGTSDGVFSLKSDYLFDGDQAVVAGAYAYRLYQNAVSTPADGDWYLRSALVPVIPPDIPPVIPPTPEVPLYQPGVPLYESYANVLQSFNAQGTLQQRVGNRSWSGAGIVETGEPADGTIQGNSIWSRIEAGHGNFDPKTSTSSAKYDIDLWKLQAGVDGSVYDGEAGRLIGGISGHYGTISSDITSIHGDGSITSTGYGLSGTLTWYASNGFYLDGQAQVSWYDSDLSSRTAGLGLTSDNNGFGYSLSIEGGQRIALYTNWSITPQAQLAYSEVSFDDFTDVFGAAVALDRGNSLKGRLGIAADYQNEWRDEAGQISRSHAYGIANLYYDFLDGSRTNVAGVKFTQENIPLWGGLGIGGSYNWTNDRYSLFGEASVNTSLGNFGDSYALKGNAGLRVKF